MSPGSKGLLNKGFQEPFFSLWEPKMENELILALLAPKVQNDPFFAFCRPKVEKGAHFWILAPKVRKRSHETLCFISLLSQGAKWTPKSDFGLPKRTFGPFRAQNPILASKIALLGPESHFGAHSAPWPKRFIKQRVSGTFFRTLGAKMRKWPHFAHFGVPNWKMCSFSTF